MSTVPFDPVDAKMREVWAKAKGRKWLCGLLQSCLDPTQIESMGCRFHIHPKDNHTEFVMWRDGLPPEHVPTQEIAKFYAGKDAVIVDVGANAGAFFVPILKACSDAARAIVFEPNPTMLDRLRPNIALNGLENVQVFDCAVGDAEGEAPLFFPKNSNLGQGRVGLSYDHAGASEGVKVKVRTLADCLDEAGADRVDFLKVDVEGLEDRVIVPLLNGPKKYLPNQIYFEVAHDGNWTYPILETLADKGYKLINNFRQNHLYARESL